MKRYSSAFLITVAVLAVASTVAARYCSATKLFDQILVAIEPAVAADEPFK